MEEAESSEDGLGTLRAIVRFIYLGNMVGDPESNCEIHLS